ncbi:DUF2264 domain-containing protein [Streptomyces himalayensis]|uniref:DUF2264 domain-containing protein n=1 Tax=Streptomyces himalayensis subsp. himalayensis TaxID=2756131 RepID=A0A7W0DK19_9ACTN|nr:DUF2264 domain-containing protein [Streptomyces himalayensis]MBA2946481.1 DUF2264 domain-containing protein [Streptomyces himalayensis subsp. himalayensis]
MTARTAAHLPSPPAVSNLPDLPPEDRLRSPVTGWTRAHWEAIADRLLDALVPYATPGFAQYRLPGPASHSGPLSDGLEGYARSFMLAAFRIAGAGGEADASLIERYAAGLAAGTDPGGPEAWPPIEDRAQPMVEAASIAIALHETRPWLWDRLDDAVRARVAEWLGGFVGKQANDSNWRLFQVVTEEFLASVGAPHSRAEIDGGLDRIEDWYRGGGWYSDGDGRKFDYYNGWAMHLYPLLWARIAGPRADPARVAAYRARLREFLSTYQYFFGSDGAPVHQGRSLIYRFATAAPLWAGALADATPLPPGRTRRIASGALRHFAERGVPDERGLLTLGWYGAFEPVTQRYSGPASPYWASKAFLGLLLPEDHPAWTAVEEPSPVDTTDACLALPEPGWLLHSTAADGIVRLLNHGSDRLRPLPAKAEDNPHYAKFGYATAAAPDTGEAAWAAGIDNHIALVDAQGVPTRRGRIHPLGTAGRRAASWHAPAEGSRIETTSVVHGPWEVRVHRVEGAAGAGVREGGWALAGADVPVTDSGPGWALARRADGLTSAIVGLHGWDSATGAVVHATDANAYGRHSATPYLALPALGGGSGPFGPIPARTSGLFVSLVVLTRDDTDGPSTADSLRAAVTAHVTDHGEGNGTVVVVRFRDGTKEEVVV